MASASMIRASVVSSIAERSLTTSSFKGRSVSTPAAALPVRRFRTYSVRAETDPKPVDVKQAGQDAQKLAKEGGSEAKSRVTEAAKDFGSSISNTADQGKKAGADAADRLKKDAKDVAEPIDDVLAKTRQEGREANAEVADKFKDPREVNLGAEIQGSAGQAVIDNQEKAKRTASKAGDAVSDSAKTQGKEFVDSVKQGFAEAGDRVKSATKDAVEDTKEFVSADGAKKRLEEGKNILKENADNVKNL